MNKQQATRLLQQYRDFPHTSVFDARPANYPLFHLLECFTKDDWYIEQHPPHVHLKNAVMRLNDFDVELLGKNLKHGYNPIWSYVARNHTLINTMVAYVQEDLYCRYVARLNPLRTPETTATFIPRNLISVEDYFEGKIGNHINLYALEIDLDLVDIKGKWDKNVPWHYLQQTIDWKPFRGRLNWQDEDEGNHDQLIIQQPVNIVAEQPARIRARPQFNNEIINDQPIQNPAQIDWEQVDIQALNVREQAYQNARYALNQAFNNRNENQPNGPRAA